MTMPDGMEIHSSPTCRIAGVVSCVPKTKKENKDFYSTFGIDDVQNVCRMTGVSQRRIAAEHRTTGDLASAAAGHLLSRLVWDPLSVDAVIFVSQTADYLFPPTSLKIHKQLGLAKSCLAFDVNLGCSGYTYGLFIASRLIDGRTIKRVLLLVGDTISKVVDDKDRSTALLFGDAASATAIDFDKNHKPMSFCLGSDGTGVEKLLVPGSGFNTTTVDDFSRASISYAPNKLYMDGAAVFEFTLRTVPLMIKALSNDDQHCDYYLFHQANEFMIKHLVKKAKLPDDKVLKNISDFGNTSSASIPLLMTTTLTKEKDGAVELALFGFGVGFSWAGVKTHLCSNCILETIEDDF